MAEALFALGVAAFLCLKAEDVEGERVEHLFQGFKTFRRNGLLLVGQLVDGATGIEEVADDDGRIEVVVEGLVAFCLHFLGVSLRERAVCSSFDAFELRDGIHEAVETLLGGLERLV